MKTIEESFARGSLAKHYEFYLTLLGLRNIAWAAECSQHNLEDAKVVKSVIQLLIDSPDNVSIVRQILKTYRMLNQLPDNTIRNVHGRWDTSPVIKEDHPSLTASERNK